MKAIHNHWSVAMPDSKNVVNNANIQNESNSQLPSGILLSSL